MSPVAPHPPATPPGALAAPGWRRPLRALRQRFQLWLLSRLPRTDTLTLNQRNIYILPTGAGWMLALTLLLLLLASINYQLNLGYLLTFLLTGSTLVGMHIGHSNLRGLALHLSPPTPVHAGQAVALDIHLTSARTRMRHGLGLGVIDIATTHTPLAYSDVPAQGSSSVQLSWRAPCRGRHRLPALRVQTLFPLGSFRVWALWQPAAQILVYPAPEVTPPALPAAEPHIGSAGDVQVQSSDEFDGVRAYRRGDPIKAVVWKKAAQSFAAGRADLFSRDALSSQRQQLWLDHARTGAPDLEARLARLSAWVLMAERQGLDYGLRLADREIAPAQGPAQRARCLEALALC